MCLYLCALLATICTHTQGCTHTHVRPRMHAYSPTMRFGLQIYKYEFPLSNTPNSLHISKTTSSSLPYIHTCRCSNMPTYMCCCRHGAHARQGANPCVLARAGGNPCKAWCAGARGVPAPQQRRPLAVYGTRCRPSAFHPARRHRCAAAVYRSSAAVYRSSAA
jgi:hypothetical protein